MKSRAAGRWALRLLLLAAVLIALAGAMYEVSRALCFQLVGDVICRVDTDRRLVALTFDDGPTPGGIDAVLPVLERHDAKATFFLVGEEMIRHPELAPRLVGAGHELGNHTHTHRRMLLRWPSTHTAEIARADALLRAAGENKPTLLRPPFGKRLLGFPLAASDAGYRTVMWDVGEAPVTEPRAYADAILANVRPGSIVLMHPMYDQQDLMREALPLILTGLEARGYQAVTVSDLLAAEGAD